MIAEHNRPVPHRLCDHLIGSERQKPHTTTLTAHLCRLVVQADDSYCSVCPLVCPHERAGRCLVEAIPATNVWLWGLVLWGFRKFGVMMIPPHRARQIIGCTEAAAVCGRGLGVGEEGGGSSSHAAVEDGLSVPGPTPRRSTGWHDGRLRQGQVVAELAGAVGICALFLAMCSDSCNS